MKRLRTKLTTLSRQRELLRQAFELIRDNVSYPPANTNAVKDRAQWLFEYSRLSKAPTHDDYAKEFDALCRRYWGAVSTMGLVSAVVLALLAVAGFNGWDRVTAFLVPVLCVSLGMLAGVAYMKPDGE